MVFVSLSCTVSVQETTSLKQPVLRTSLAPQKGARRSLDVCAHVLATQVSPSDSNVAPSPVQTSSGLRLDGVPQTHWTPAWTKTLQTKFSAVWERWQKLSAQLSQCKAMRPDWVAQTQVVLDQHLQRFLGSVGAAAPAGAAAGPSARPAVAAVASAAAASLAARPVSLTPYLTVADDVEVSFAAMLADLCNMAYEVDKLDPELIEARHHLSLIATSLSCSASCPGSPAASVDSAAASPLAFDSGSEAEAPQQPLAAGRSPAAGQGPANSRAPRGGDSTAAATASAAPLRHGRGQASRSAGDTAPPPASGAGALPGSISLLQLTSPEAVTAALTSQGHGAAFAHPVYVSSLLPHHPLASLGSYDEEGDISDLELRAAMLVAARGGGAGGVGPTALLLGAGGAGGAGFGDAAAVAAAAAAGVGSLGTMGTIATLDEIPAYLLTQMAAAPPPPPPGTLLVGGFDDASDTAMVMGAAAAAAGGAAGTLFSDAQLSEDRDFVSGYVYGYHTQLVERRRSSSGDSGAGADGDAADGSGLPAAAAVTQSGAAGGRALRAEQEGVRRRRSLSQSGMEAAAAAEVDVGLVGEDGGVSAVAGGPPVVVACTKAPPNAWFACDDKLTKTRYFAIQGSTSLEHWQINLQFEPVVFEDAKYGVRIHRGVYEAAKVLYDDLLPLVRQHLDTSPYASLSFTGHSLGGSLATVLMLLFVVRGVLPPARVSPVYTFGAPAVFCQGAVADAPADRCHKCTFNCEDRPSHGGAEGAAAASGGGVVNPLASIAAAASSMEQVQAVPLGLMAGLGLSDDRVVNVIMHKDVVPRAFVCDYTAVEGMLQRWWPWLREHHSRQEHAGGPHKSLYNFVGRVAVLRPRPDLPFVNGPADAAHPMLPNHPALYRVGLNEDLLPSYDTAAATMASWDELLGGLGGLSAFGAAARSMAQHAASSGTGFGCRRRSGAASARRAAKLEGMQKSVMQFMNQPHPLATLSDYQAYGPHGFISRFHNPDNYTHALRALIGR